MSAPELGVPGSVGVATCRRCGETTAAGCEDWDCHLGWGDPLRALLEAVAPMLWAIHLRCQRHRVRVVTRRKSRGNR